MTAGDDAILEVLSETGAILNKKALEINLKSREGGPSYSTIQRRLAKLESVGLVEVAREQGSWYRITEKGERYLEGAEDLSGVPDPDDADAG